MAITLGTPSAENMYPEICRTLAAKGIKPGQARDPWYPRERTPEYVRDLIARSLSLDMPKGLSCDFPVECRGIRDEFVALFNALEEMYGEQVSNEDIGRVLWNGPRVIEPFFVCLVLGLCSEAKRSLFQEQLCKEKKPRIGTIITHYLIENGLCLTLPPPPCGTTEILAHDPSIPHSLLCRQGRKGSPAHSIAPDFV